MVDVICSKEYYKKKLIFTNTKNAKNGEIYGKARDELLLRNCQLMELNRTMTLIKSNLFLSKRVEERKQNQEKILH